MNSQTGANSKIQEAMAGHTSHEYDSLPESIKLVHTKEQYAWLGSEKHKVIERECNPDYDVVE